MMDELRIELWYSNILCGVPTYLGEHERWYVFRCGFSLRLGWVRLFASARHFVHPASNPIRLFFILIVLFRSFPHERQI